LILGLDREYAYLTLHAMAKLYRKCLNTYRTQRHPISSRWMSVCLAIKKLIGFKG